MLASKIKVKGPGTLFFKILKTAVSIGFVKDERFGGQKDFDKNIPQGQQSLYGVGIDISKFDIWNKTGYVFKGKPYQSIGWMNQFTYHQQDSFFGQRNYLGNQKTFYSNLIFESIFGNTNHKYKTGASFLITILLLIPLVEVEV